MWSSSNKKVVNENFRNCKFDYSRWLRFASGLRLAFSLPSFLPFTTSLFLPVGPPLLRTCDRRPLLCHRRRRLWSSRSLVVSSRRAFRALVYSWRFAFWSPSYCSSSTLTLILVWNLNIGLLPGAFVDVFSHLPCAPSTDAKVWLWCWFSQLLYRWLCKITFTFGQSSCFVTPVHEIGRIMSSLS